MKNYYQLLFVILVLVFASCSKQDDVIPNEVLTQSLELTATAQFVDTVSIQKQLSMITDLTKTAVKDSLSAKSKLKDAVIVDLNHIILNPVSQNDYYVNNNEAVKLYDYMALTLNSYVNDEFAIYQIFPIINGVVDSLHFRIEYEVGPPSSSRSFYLKSSNNLVRTSYHFHFDSGKQIDFYGNSNNSYFTLPNYPNGHWKLVFEYNVYGNRKFYESEVIDYYGETNQIQLNLQLQSENTVSVIELDKSLIQGANRLEIQGFDVNGIYQYLTIPVDFDINSPNVISYSLPIDPSFVYICSDYSCSFYQAKIVGINSGNISVFNLEKIW